MTSPTTRQEHALTGSCPCSGVSWKAKLLPRAICVCHCVDCRSSSPSRSPIPFAFFPNDCIWFSSGDCSPAMAEHDVSNIKHVQESRAVRGVCERCKTLIYMRYHASPRETDVNMALCDDKNEVTRLRDATIHIFCEGDEKEVQQGQETWRGFSDQQRQNMEIWEREGRKRRLDV